MMESVQSSLILAMRNSNFAIGTGMCNCMNVDAVRIHTTWDFEDYLNILHELLRIFQISQVLN